LEEDDDDDVVDDDDDDDGDYDDDDDNDGDYDGDDALSLTFFFLRFYFFDSECTLFLVASLSLSSRSLYSCFFYSPILFIGELFPPPFYRVSSYVFANTRPISNAPLTVFPIVGFFQMFRSNLFPY
jgi:hypothetical protein